MSKSIAQSKNGASPTMRAFGSFDAAYSFFNRELFGGSLPHCLINMQRHSRSFGYFCAKRFFQAHGKGKAGGKRKMTTSLVGTQFDEIAINPMHVAERTPEKVLSTLVHEMVHCWQHHHGKEPTRCYHDKQWAGKMKEVGLQPSTTGEPGGKETGPKCSHYIINGGPFATACAAFMKKNETAFFQDTALVQGLVAKAKKKKGGDGEGDDDEEPAAKSPGRIKFQCFGCKLNAWAKPSANLRCGDCDRPLKAAEAEDDE